MNKDLYRRIDDESVIKGEKLPIVEEFYSIQGEGFHAGKPAYFIRVGGCDIACHFCDTKISWDPWSHALISIEDVVGKVMATAAKSVVVTGGEPAMYDLTKLTTLIKRASIASFIETSGAYPLTGEWDWICVSPKQAKPPLMENMKLAHELKVVICNLEDLRWAEKWENSVNSSCRLFLQPEFSQFDSIIGPMVEYVKNNPQWNISLQIHKYMQIP